MIIFINDARTFGSLSSRNYVEIYFHELMSLKIVHLIQIKLIGLNYLCFCKQNFISYVH